MNIVRNGKNITLTNEELMAAFNEMDHQYLMEGAKSAFMELFDDAAHFEKTFGFPPHLAIDENSPYCILQEAIERFAEQQDSHVADATTWNNVFDDIISAIRNRWDIGEIPFSGTSVTLSDAKLLKTMRITEDDDYLVYQVETDENQIIFDVDVRTFDVNKAFGLFCNTSVNEYNHANVYINWHPNQAPTMTVCYVAYNEERLLPVVLTAEQQEMLQNLLPNMCLMALNRRPEDIWTDAQKEKEPSVCETFAKENGKKVPFNASRAVTLHHTRYLKDSDTVEDESIVFDGKWLEKRLSQNDISLDGFMNSYTSEDVDGLLGDAILQDGILFICRPGNDEPFECMNDDVGWKLLAFADMLSQVLNDNHFEDASKYLDSFLNL